MKNKYKFIDEDCKTIYAPISPDRVIPDKDQHIIVRNYEYSVFRVDEVIDYDSFCRNITVYLNNLEDK